VHAERRHGKPRSRILYWFRTPPGVRVGRAPLDEDAIRLIEKSNPGVEFDWTRILKGQDAPAEPRPPVQHERRARPRPSYTGPPSGAGPSQRSGPPRTAPLPSVVEPPEQATVPAAGLADPMQTEPLEPPDAESEVQLRSSTPSAASTRLGSEGLARLRARHAEVLARISEKATDPAQREQLKASAERLNPDTWVTEAEVVAGLESYEAVFEAVRGVIGQRRNRRRGRPGNAGDAERPADGGAAANHAEGAPTEAPIPGGGPSAAGTQAPPESGGQDVPRAHE